MRIEQRHGTAAEWAQANPVLLDGEFGVDDDSRQYKIGDGETRWNDLPFAASGGSGSGSTWDDLPGKPEVIAAGATQADARTAINAADADDITTLTSELAAKADAATVTSELAAKANTSDMTTALAAKATTAALTTGLAAKADATALAAKYTKPSSGIPATDLAAAVQTTLGLANTALQVPAVAGVQVVTGSETRPTAALVIWVGGTSAPTNIATGDLWLEQD